MTILIRWLLRVPARPYSPQSLGNSPFSFRGLLSTSIWPGNVALSLLWRTNQGCSTFHNAWDTSDPQRAQENVNARAVGLPPYWGNIKQHSFIFVLSSPWLFCVYIAPHISIPQPHSHSTSTPTPIPTLIPTPGSPAHTEEAGKQDDIFSIPLDLRLPVTWLPPSRHHRRFADPWGGGFSTGRTQGTHCAG